MVGTLLGTPKQRLGIVLYLAILWLPLCMFCLMRLVHTTDQFVYIYKILDKFTDFIGPPHKTQKSLLPSDAADRIAQDLES